MDPEVLPLDKGDILSSMVTRDRGAINMWKKTAETKDM